MTGERLSSKKLPLALAAVLLLGLGLRLHFAWSSKDLPPAIGDAADYASIAENVARRGEFSLEAGVPTARRPPAYPAFLALFLRFTPTPWNSVRLVQAVLDTATCLIVFLLAWLHYRRREEALLAAALYALHPVFAAYVGVILTETLFLALWGGAVWCLVLLARHGEEGRPAAGAALWGAAAGFMLGIAILCRANLILFPPAVAFFLLLFHRRPPPDGLPRRAALLRSPAAAFPRQRAWSHFLAVSLGRPRGLLLGLAVMVLCSYLVILPWSARNRAVFGRRIPVGTGGGVAFWVGAQTARPYPDHVGMIEKVSAGRTDSEADEEFYRLAKEDIRRNWPGVLADLPRRFAHFWLTSHSSILGVDESLAAYRAQGRWGPVLGRVLLWALHLSLLAAGALGLWLARKKWSPLATITLAAFLYYSLHVLNDYWPNRYHLPSLMLLLVFAAGAVLRAWGFSRADQESL